MLTETLILKTKISSFFKPETIAFLMKIGYQKTDNKFHLLFAGSKGYLDHIEVGCEGYQLANNRILWDKLLKATGGFKNDTINIYWSEQKGVRLSLGTDIALLLATQKPTRPVEKTNNSENTSEEDMMPY